MARASLVKHPVSARLWITREGWVMRRRCGAPQQSDSRRLHIKSQVRSGRETNYCLKCQPLQL